MFQSVPILLDEEKMAKERKKKLRELLTQTFKENHQVGIVTSLFSAFCSINDKGLHQRCDSVTLSPTEPCYKYQNCPHRLLCATQLTQYIREHFDLLFRGYSYIICVILRNWGMNLGCLSKLPFLEQCVSTNVDLWQFASIASTLTVLQTTMFCFYSEELFRKLLAFWQLRN